MALFLLPAVLAAPVPFPWLCKGKLGAGGAAGHGLNFCCITAPTGPICGCHRQFPSASYVSPSQGMSLKHQPVFWEPVLNCSPLSLPLVYLVRMSQLVKLIGLC